MISGLPEPFSSGCLGSILQITSAQLFISSLLLFAMALVGRWEVERLVVVVALKF